MVSFWQRAVATAEITEYGITIIIFNHILSEAEHIVNTIGIPDKAFANMGVSANVEVLIGKSKRSIFLWRDVLQSASTICIRFIALVIRLK